MTQSIVKALQNKLTIESAGPTVWLQAAAARRAQLVINRIERFT